MVKQKGKHILLTVIVLIVSLPAFFFFSNKSKETKTQTTPTPTPKPQSTFDPQEVDYSKWEIYTNKVYNYVINYPSDWEIDTSKDSQLVITNGKSEWILSLNLTSSEDGKFDKYNFPEYCKPFDNSPCAYTKEGPINLGNTESKNIYKQAIIDTENNKSIFASIGAGGSAFSFRLEQDITDGGTQYAIIKYTGDSLDDDMIPLDQITNSLKFK